MILALDSDAKLHAGLALVTDGQVVDLRGAGLSSATIADCRSFAVRTPRRLTQAAQIHLIPTLWKLAADDQQPAPQRFRAACSLAAFDPSSPLWNEPTFVRVACRKTCRHQPEYIGNFRELLRTHLPAARPALSNIFRILGGVNWQKHWLHHC